MTFSATGIKTELAAGMLVFAEIAKRLLRKTHVSKQKT
jgi:hypothetical protein